MIALMMALMLVLLLDQGLKWVVLRWLKSKSISLGSLGSIRVVKGKLWFSRAWPSLRTPYFVLIWISSAAALAVVTWFLPSAGWLAGLLLGGALSHGLEAPQRGWICDYICLRFWPAFNFADLCVTLGAAGLSLKLML